MTEFEEGDADLEDTGDDARWTVSRAAAQLLQEVAGLVGDAAWRPTVEFMGPKLNSDRWQDQYVGMTALGSVLEGPSSQMLFNQMEGPLGAIMQTADTNAAPRVRFTSASVIAKTCHVVPQLLLASEANLNSMFTTCINRIN